jgi:hypothetical protein
MVQIRFPTIADDPNGHFFDVKLDYGAAGDGVTDDTPAIQAALTAASTGANFQGANGTTYFPAGTYLISARLITHKVSGTSSSRQRLIGEDKATTIIKLKDNCTGFGNVAVSPTTFYPRAMFRNGSSTTTGGQDGGNNGFNNSVRNLTFDIGAGNPGACAIDHNGNNWSLLEDLILKSSDPDFIGHSLLYMGRNYPGPGYGKNIELYGSDFPLFLGAIEYSFAFEGLKIRNARRQAIYCPQNALILKDGDIVGTPNIKGGTIYSYMTLLDTSITYTGPHPIVTPKPPPPPPPSIALDTGPGKAFLQNVRVDLFEHLGIGPTLPGTGTYPLITTDAQICSLFGNGTGLVPLMAEDPTVSPAPYDPGDPTKWNVISLTPADSTVDSGPAIQAGLDSAAEVVVIPPGVFYVKDPLLVRGSTKRLYSAGALLLLKSDASGWNDPNNPKSFIRFTSATTDCVLDSVDGGDSADPAIGGTLGYVFISHESPRNLYVRDSATFQVSKLWGYRNTVDGTGKIYLGNTALGAVQINGQQLWARNLNMETYTQAAGTGRFHNNGGQAWILGLKTEGKGTIILAENGSKTVLYGGFIYPNQDWVGGDGPLFKVIDSEFSANWVEMTFSGARVYQDLVAETVGAETRVLRKVDVGARGAGSGVMLYSNV